MHILPFRQDSAISLYITWQYYLFLTDDLYPARNRRRLDGGVAIDPGADAAVIASSVNADLLWH
ncbi:Hypothetical protein ETEE_3766 [Edwardsiella anguillarum ET080813]|uniref:Uncharacterized protein n=1 Tax=Edwardsiella anguillarum ET080813 TaxID=667120 RepID=A0A076LUP5_9GAMM|nr:Hypothetical protein ETEE_3766 [Edwardsiella anguillarum ET080813]